MCRYRVSLKRRTGRRGRQTAVRVPLRCRENIGNPWIDVPHTRSQAFQVQSDPWQWQRVHNERARTRVPSFTPSERAAPHCDLVRGITIG